MDEKLRKIDGKRYFKMFAFSKEINLMKKKVKLQERGSESEI